MKKGIAVLAISLLQACTTPSVMNPQACVGTTALPPALAGQFEAVNDPVLLNSALGEPGSGGLCQGQVYRSKSDVRVPVYRLWNSTNPGSELGNWWTFDHPGGLVADYRASYEICYQWSPLDKLSACTLTGGEKIVVGNGQSATCSEYLEYPASAAQQVYISVAATALENCSSYDAVLQWDGLERE